MLLLWHRKHITHLSISVFKSRVSKYGVINVKVSRVGDQIQILVFGFSICLPLLVMVMGMSDNQPTSENRVLADFPKVNSMPIEDVPQKIDDWYNDHFGFREQLVKLHAQFYVDALKTTETENVIVGQDDWLFLKGTRSSAAGINFKAWADHLKAKQEWLKLQGIEYLFVVSPNKATIYAEFLPANLPLLNPTPIEQFLTQMKGTEVRSIDLREPLRSAKSKGIVYHKNNTHWNDFGSYVVYREICSQVKLSMASSPYEIADFTIQQIEHQGDLPPLIGLEQSALTEDWTLKSTRRAERVKTSNPLFPEEIQPRFFETTQPGQKLLVIHDSFFNDRSGKTGVNSLLAEHFRQSLFLRNSVISLTQLKEIVKDQKPNLVIEEIVERNLKLGPPD